MVRAQYSNIELRNVVTDLMNYSFLGVNRLCRDTEFMSGRNPGLYWRLCWGIISPAILITVLLYTFASYKPLTYQGKMYPDTAYGMNLHSLKLD